MKDADVTPPEVREMVDRTLELLRRQVGSVRANRRPVASEAVEQRLEMIRRQAMGPGTAAEGK